MPSRHYSIGDLLLLRRKPNIHLSKSLKEQLTKFGLLINATSTRLSSQKRFDIRNLAGERSSPPVRRYSIIDLLLLRGKQRSDISDAVKHRLKYFNLFVDPKRSTMVSSRLGGEFCKEETSKQQRSLKSTKFEVQKLEKMYPRKIDFKESLKGFLRSVLNTAFDGEDAPVLSFTQGRSRRFVAPSREEMIAYIPPAARNPSPTATNGCSSGAIQVPLTDAGSAEVTASKSGSDQASAGSCVGSDSPREESCSDLAPVIVESPVHDLHARLLANSDGSEGWVRVCNIDDKLVRWIVAAFAENSTANSDDDECLTFWSLLDSYGELMEVCSSQPRSVDLKYRSKDSCTWAQESLDGQYLFSNEAIQCRLLEM